MKEFGNPKSPKNKSNGITKIMKMKKKHSKNQILVQNEITEEETITKEPKIKKQKTENDITKEEIKSSSPTIPKKISEECETPVSIHAPPPITRKINFKEKHTCCSNHITNRQLRSNTAFYFGHEFPNSTDVWTNFDIQKTKSFLKETKTENLMVKEIGIEEEFGPLAKSETYSKKIISFGSCPEILKVIESLSCSICLVKLASCILSDCTCRICTNCFLDKSKDGEQVCPNCEKKIEHIFVL